MNNYLLYADLHYHLFKEFSVNPNFDGNWRLENIRRVFEQIINYGIKHKCRVIDLGDTFHAKGDLISTTVLSSFVETMQGTITSLLGNHSYIVEDKTVQDLIKKRFTVYTKPTELHHDDAFLYFLPYYSVKSELNDSLSYLKTCMNTNRNIGGKKKVHILFHHGEVTGGIMSGEYKAKYVTDPETLEDFDFVFLGHLHKHQVLGKKKNIDYVGSPLHQNWNDVGSQKGFIHLKINEGEVIWEFIKTKYPEFIPLEIKGKRDVKKINDNNYYKVVKTPILSVSERWNVINPYKFEHKEKILEEPLNFSEDEVAVLKNYLKYKEEELENMDLNAGIIFKAGKEIIEKVRFSDGI